MPAREEHADHLKRQIERTRGTYLMMREAGYEKDRHVRLRFAYRGAPKERADELAEYLRKQTKYRVEVESDDEVNFIVHGATQPTKLNAASLGRWVYWMYRAGYRYDCVFDGWGAKV